MSVHDQLIASYRIPDPWIGQGKTRHARHGADVTSFVAEIRVMQLEGDAGYYIFYCDSHGGELNDLSFDTLEDVKQHLLFEFGPAIDDWLVSP